MNSKRFYYLMLGCITCLVLALAGGAYAASKILQQESNQLLNNRLEAAVLSAEQTQLTQAKHDVQKYQGLATIAQSVVPQDKDQAQTVQQIADIANANGIQLSSITFPSSTLGQVTAGNKPQLSQLKPVKGISGVYNLDLVVQSAQAQPIPYSQFISFLSDLEHNRRTALVNSVTILPNPKDRSTLSFTLDLNEYIKP